MSWCAGYLADEALVDFLSRAQAWLKKPRGWIKGRTIYDNYIYLIDNVAEGQDKVKPEKGQRVRCRESFEKIFNQAELKIRRYSTPRPLKKNYDDVMMWCLQ